MRKKTKPESDNTLINELRDVEFIKQPYLYAMLGADFTLVQRSIMIEIINSLQMRFNAFLKHQKYADEDGQLSLFSEDERNKEIKTFKISAASLGVKPYQYAELQEACDNLSRIHFSFLEYDKSTDTYMRTYANLFSAISMPISLNNEYKYKYEHKDENDVDKGKRRRSGYIVARMDIKVLENLCNLGNGQGYIDHIYRIARISKCKRTPGIYIYLARWAKDFSKKAVNYVELKKFLGIITQKEEKGEGGRIVKCEVDKYPKFSKFRKEVMEPLKKDLDRLADENHVEFSFDYEPAYKTLVKRGDPEEIIFHIKLSKLGEELKKQRSIKAPSDTWEILRGEFKFTDFDIKSLSDMLSSEMIDAFRVEVIALIERMKKFKVKNKKAYAIASLRNYILQHNPETELTDSEININNRAGESVLETQANEVRIITEKEIALWKQFTESLLQETSKRDFDIWLSAIKFISFQNNLLTLSVPTRYVFEYVEKFFKEAVYLSVKKVYGEKAKYTYISEDK